MLFAALLISAMAFCGIVSADLTNITGTLSASAEIVDLNATQAIGTASVNVEKFAAFDPFTVNANAGWTINVYGPNLATTTPSPDTATNALKLYANNAGNTDPATGASLPTVTGSAQFTGGDGPTLPRALKFSQIFTWDDLASNGYTSTINVDIAPTA